MKQSVLPRRQHSNTSVGFHFYAFFAFIAFIALGAGASAAAFFAPFFAMLLIAGDRKGTLGMQVSLKTSFLEPVPNNASHAMCQHVKQGSMINASKKVSPLRAP